MLQELHHSSLFLQLDPVAQDAAGKLFLYVRGSIQAAVAHYIITLHRMVQKQKPFAVQKAFAGHLV